MGKATVLLFAREGAKVVFVGRDESRGRATVSIIDNEGGQATFVKADVSRSSDVKKMVEETIQTDRRSLQQRRGESDRHSCGYSGGSLELRN